jgi:hypothetical protein
MSKYWTWTRNVRFHYSMRYSGGEKVRTCWSIPQTYIKYCQSAIMRRVGRSIEKKRCSRVQAGSTLTRSHPCPRRPLERRNNQGTRMMESPTAYCFRCDVTTNIPETPIMNSLRSRCLLYQIEGISSCRSHNTTIKQ